MIVLESLALSCPEKAMPAQLRFRFDSFEVCPQQRRIWKHGMKLKLHGQPLQILLMLLDRPGDVVTREHIRNRLWPKETFVDFEHSVNTAVKKLRQTLGDSVQTPRYVETLPGVGYRFIMTVHKASEAVPVAGLESTEEEVAAKALPSRVPWFQVMFVSAAILVLAFLGYYFFFPVPVPRATRVTEITHSGRVDGWGGLVYDGTRLYFLERDGGHWNLMQTSATGGPAEPFPAPFLNTRIMDIAPDHSQFLIASFIERDANLPIWVMPLQGGPPRRLGNIISGSVSWAPSGKQIIYSAGHDLMEIDSDGSNSHRLLTAPGFPSSPIWSPDGRRIRFSVDRGGGGQAEIWEATADGKRLHPLFAKPNQFQLTCCGQWTPDGRYFIFTAKKGEDTELWAIQERSSLWRRRNPDPVELTASPNMLWYPVLSRDGHTAYAFSYRPTTEDVRLDIGSGKTAPVIPESDGHAPFFAADGQWVAYESGTPRTIWRSKVDGSEALQLTDRSLNAFEPHWSPDGKKIAFVAQVVGRPWRTYLISADGGKPQPVLPQFDETGRPDWSPDGKMLVLEAREGPISSDLDPQANSSLYLMNLATGEATKLQGSDGFTGPRWSPDGKFIAAANDPNDSLMVYDLSKRKWIKAGIATYLSALAWSKNGQYLYYQDVLGKDEPIFRVHMPDLRREAVFDFHELLGGKVFRCAFVNLDPSESPIVSLSLSDNDIYAIDLDLP